MKTHLAYLLVMVFHIIHNGYAQVGVNTSSPHASSIMDITSTSAGMLIPRMTEAQKNAISSPATGLLVFQTDEVEGLYFYDGAKWRTAASNDRTVTTITSTTTLDDGHDILLINNSSEIDVDLPTAANQDGRTYYLKKISDNTTRVRIDPNGSQTIDGLDTLELFVQYDAVRIVSDGSNWLIISDERQPHMAKMSRTTTQTVTDNTVTKIAVNNEVFDVGGIADVATNDRFEIRRAGKYLVTGLIGFDSVSDGVVIFMFIYVNGSTVAQVSHTAGATSDNIIDISTVIDLSVGDYIELYGKHKHGSNRNTFSTTQQLPRITITEIKN